MPVREDPGVLTLDPCWFVRIYSSNENHHLTTTKILDILVEVLTLEISVMVTTEIGSEYNLSLCPLSTIRASKDKAQTYILFKICREAPDIQPGLNHYLYCMQNNVFRDYQLRVCSVNYLVLWENQEN